MAVKINYVDKTNGKTSSVKNSRKQADTLSIDNMVIETQVVEVQVGDGKNAYSTPKSFTVTPLFEEDINQKSWTVIDFQSEETSGEGAVNGRASCTIDGDLTTFWHSVWTSSGAELPAWITYDMKKEIVLSKVATTRRPGNTSLKTVEIYVSNNPNDFGEKVGTIAYVSGDSGGATKWVALPVPARGRYLKLKMPDSTSGSAVLSMAEVQAKGSTNP